MRDDEFEDSGFEDEGPTAEELAEIKRASAEDAAAVDALILSKCAERWRKVAMVVGSSLSEFEARFPDLPYVYLQVRIVELANQGRLEVEGNVWSMRHSEVRLPREGDRDA